jgi:hypothetical protein
MKLTLISEPTGGSSVLDHFAQTIGGMPLPTSGHHVSCELLESRRLLSATLTTLAVFNQSTGTKPSNLVIDSTGDLFGTTSGSQSNEGTVFEIAAGTRQLTTLVTFNGANGSNPDGLLVDANGNLFGTTSGGGNLSLNGGDGDGTVFEIPAGSHTVTTIAVFNGSNGRLPAGGIVEDTAGNLYGTAGSIFKVAAGSHVLSVLLSSAPTGGGGAPLAIDSQGDLYGTSAYGQDSSYYSIYELPTGAKSLTTLAYIAQIDYGALSPVTLDADGNLDVTASNGVYQISVGTAAAHGVAYIPGLSLSFSGILVDSQGDLFGVTPSDSNDQGSIFEVMAGDHAVTTIATFNGGNGADPQGALISDSAGDLYGTADDANPVTGTPDPGLDGGSVFEISGRGFAVGNSAPVIFTQPSSQTILASHIASFTAVIGSSPAPAIQWQASTDGGGTFQKIVGNDSATTETLVLTGIASDANGTQYRAGFTNSLGAVTSRAATLTVVPVALVSAAHASPSSVTGTSTVLSALGETSSGEAGLTYRWSVVAAPAGATSPTYSANKSNAAQRTVVRFHKDGYYRFRCTISDGRGHTLATDVSVDVVQTATSLRLTPHDKTIQIGQTIQYHAALYDQFGHPLRTQPAVTYSIVHGPGTIGPSSGIFTSSIPGAALIQADEGDFTGTVGLQVIP